MSNRLPDRTALVTGSTSGIGAAIAIAFAAEGAKVIVSGRDSARGEAVVKTIREAGGRAEFVAGDLSGGAASAQKLAAKSAAAFGSRIDILVNNAAYLVGGADTLKTTEEQINNALLMNIGAPFLLTAAVLPQMLDNGGGVVVNVGSINGAVGMAGAALYGASKAGLHSLTKSWAAEFGPRGVRFNTLAPGPTMTEGNEPIKAYIDVLMASTPAGRPGRVEDVAAAAVFLASDDAVHIHGTTLFVDGGFTS
ncbi:MAG: short-chain dehydrogenase/reductase [Pseudonocardiales bacterium]|nr:short-chain dehydrogenase/reductase [Pseudonocardiales bacterium]